MPEWLIYLRENIAGSLPEEKQSWWRSAFALSMPEGVDLDPAYHEICIAILKRQLERRQLWNAAAYGDAVAYAIELAISYHENPTPEAAKFAKVAAWNAEYITKKVTLQRNPIDNRMIGSFEDQYRAWCAREAAACAWYSTDVAKNDVSLVAVVESAAGSAKQAALARRADEQLAAANEFVWIAEVAINALDKRAKQALDKPSTNQRHV